MYNTYIWLYNVQLFVVKKQRCTMLYKSAHHLELAVQGIIKPKKNPPPPKRIIKKKAGTPPSSPLTVSQHHYCCLSVKKHFFLPRPIFFCNRTFFLITRTYYLKYFIMSFGRKSNVFFAQYSSSSRGAFFCSQLLPNSF